MLLEELFEKENYYESECKDKDEEHERKVEKGKTSAASRRQKVMESPGETLKRSRSDSEESGEEKPRKRRSKCSEAIEYLQGKNEPYLELKRKQLEINEKKQNLCEGQHQDFMLLMQNMQANTMKLMEAEVQQMKNMQDQNWPLFIFEMLPSTSW